MKLNLRLHLDSVPVPAALVAMPGHTSLVYPLLQPVHFQWSVYEQAEHPAGHPVDNVDMDILVIISLKH